MSYIWRNTISTIVFTYNIAQERCIFLSRIVSMIYFSLSIYHLKASCVTTITQHDDVIKWKHFPRHWPFVRGIHRSPVNSPHKGQWRGALMFPSISARINVWANNREAGDLRRHRAHYDVTVLMCNNHYSKCVINNMGAIFNSLPIEGYLTQKWTNRFIEIPSIN